MQKKIMVQILVTLMIASPTMAGTYATISIDGNFADWADVPLVASDPLDNASGVDLANLKVANDDNLIYVYLTLHAAADGTQAGLVHRHQVLAVEMHAARNGLDQAHDRTARGRLAATALADQ